MCQSRGAIRFEPLFTTADIGLRPEASVEHIVKAFLNVGEALAARWIEMPRGILLLQSVPDQPASGAIYLYDRERHIFYFVSFVDGRDDALTTAEFDLLCVFVTHSQRTLSRDQLLDLTQGHGAQSFDRSIELPCRRTPRKAA